MRHDEMTVKTKVTPTSPQVLSKTVRHCLDWSFPTNLLILQGIHTYFTGTLILQCVFTLIFLPCGFASRSSNCAPGWKPQCCKGQRDFLISWPQQADQLDNVVNVVVNVAAGLPQHVDQRGVVLAVQCYVLRQLRTEAEVGNADHAAPCCSTLHGSAFWLCCLNIHSSSNS